MGFNDTLLSHSVFCVQSVSIMAVFILSAHYVLCTQLYILLLSCSSNTRARNRFDGEKDCAGCVVASNYYCACMALAVIVWA